MHDLNTIKKMNSQSTIITFGSEDELKQKSPEKGTMVWTDQLVMDFARVYSGGAYGQYVGCKTMKAKLDRFKDVWDEETPIGSQASDWLTVGDIVLWSGSWGRDIQKEAKVTKIETECNDLAREGTSNFQVLWAVSDNRDTVVTLDNGHWAYGFQIKPSTPNQRCDLAEMKVDKSNLRYNDDGTVDFKGDLNG